jgi:transposase-like protein
VGHYLAQTVGQIWMQFNSITVSREAIRLWCIKFGVIYTRRLKRKHRGYGDTFFIDEVFVKINGKQYGTNKLT